VAASGFASVVTSSTPEGWPFLQPNYSTQVLPKGSKNRYHPTPYPANCCRVRAFLVICIRLRAVAYKFAWDGRNYWARIGQLCNLPHCRPGRRPWPAQR